MIWTSGISKYIKIIIVLLTIFLTYKLYFTYTEVNKKAKEEDGISPHIEGFIHLPHYLATKHQPIKDNCQDVFNLKRFNFSEKFYKHLDSMNSLVRKMVKIHGGQESDTNDAHSSMIVLHTLASIPNVRTICESGFNLGRSSYNFLTAKKENRVFSFDLGNHGYARPMAEFLGMVFPGRHQIFYGDSTVTIPNFLEKSEKSLKCDIIFVDGGHTNKVACADLKNFREMATVDRTLFIFDDHPTVWSSDFGKCWNDFVKEGFIQEIAACTNTIIKGTEMGISFGRLIK